MSQILKNVKILFIPFSIGLLLLLCSPSTNFSTRKECFDAVDNMEYDGIIKVWGEPDSKSEASVDDQSIVQQEAGAAHTIDLRQICLFIDLT